MRALLLVLDSVGIGHAPDAAAYGDEGANTLGHILERRPDLALPALWGMGLGRLVGREFFGHEPPGRRGWPSPTPPDLYAPTTGEGRQIPSVEREPLLHASHGRMRERSTGKDTTTGHWELAGVILDEPFPVFEQFPDELVAAIE